MRMDARWRMQTLDPRTRVFELKTGRATDTSDKAVKEQRERTLRNMPFGTRYEYIQVYGVD